MDISTDTDSPTASHEARRIERAAHEWVHLGIRIFVLGLSLVLWTVMGFLVWVPLLLRAIILMAGAVLYSTLLRRDTRRAEARLAHAMGFFPRGYTLLLKAVNGDAVQDHDDEEGPGFFQRLKATTHFIAEIIVALAFWYALGAIASVAPVPDFSALGQSLLSTVTEVRNWISR